MWPRNATNRIIGAARIPPEQPNHWLALRQGYRGGGIQEIQSSRVAIVDELELRWKLKIMIRQCQNRV